MNTRRRLGACVLTAALLASLDGAYADPRSEFFCRMLSDSDARVRMSAALRLGTLRAADSVDPLVTALGRESNATARVAMLSAIGSIGDSRALRAVEQAAQDPSPLVRTQAARTAATLRATSARPDPVSPAAAARYRVGIGAVAASPEHRASVAELARRSLTEALGTHPEVVLADGPDAHGAARLRGYFFDGSVRTTTTPEGNLRVELSLVVQTDPGREFRFESVGSATVTNGISAGGAVSRDAAEDIAIRRAASAAVERTLTQLAATR